jgi:hypothetical protein
VSLLLEQRTIEICKGYIRPDHALSRLEIHRQAEGDGKASGTVEFQTLEKGERDS